LVSWLSICFSSFMDISSQESSSSRGTKRVTRRW
jgi:hypothetical protein